MRRMMLRFVFFHLGRALRAADDANDRTLVECGSRLLTDALQHGEPRVEKAGSGLAVMKIPRPTPVAARPKSLSSVISDVVRGCRTPRLGVSRDSITEPAEL